MAPPRSVEATLSATASGRCQPRRDHVPIVVEALLAEARSASSDKPAIALWRQVQTLLLGAVYTDPGSRLGA